jgi:GNAT superfamily N-acetyltransferase
VTQPASRSLRSPKVSGRAKLELVRAGPQPAPLAGANKGPPDTISASTRPDLTFQVEKFHEIARELPPLFERHYREIALDQESIPLDPDWDRYLQMSLAGMLRVMTARSFDLLPGYAPSEESSRKFGIIVGYIFNLVGPHLHYRSTLFANLEMFWLDPAYRGGPFALRWFKANADMLKELGVKKVTVETKNGYMDGRVGLIFKRLGYKPIETVWARTL